MIKHSICFLLLLTSKNKISSNMSHLKETTKQLIGTQRIDQLKQWRSAAQGWLGYALLPLYPQRAEKIAQETFTLFHDHSYQRHPLDNLLRAGLAHKAVRQQDNDQLATYHRDFWSGNEGTIYHETQQDKFEEVFLGHFAFTVDLLADILAANPQITTLCEIGSGSGQLLDHLASQLPQIEQFIGVDLSPGVTEANRQRYPNPKLTFIAADAHKWILEHGQPNWLFVSFRGVLEYFPQSDLEMLLSHIATQLQPAAFLAIEPIDRDHDLDHDPNSHTYGDDYSFSHNYPHLFQQTGYTLRHVSHKVLYHHREFAVLATVGINEPT